VISGPPAELQRRDIPPWLDRLRRQMLSPHPEERPAASDARTVLLENCTRYHLASQTLIKLYSTVIGQQRSGLTEHLLSLREEIQIFRETSGPLHRVAAPVEEPSPRKPTAIEVEPTAIDDAVPQIRRKDARRHTPSDPSEQGSTRSHTSTLGTIVEQVEPTERLSTEEVMRLAAMRMVQLEAVEPVEQTQDVPAPFVEEPAPVVAAVATEPSLVVPSPVVPTPTTPDVPAVVIAPTRTPARRGSLPALVAGMGLLILALVACVIWLATRQQPTNASPETTEPTTPPTSAAPSTAEVAAVDTKSVVPEPEPTVEAPKPAALPPPEPVPVPAESAPEPEPTPVAEPPSPETKPVAPKPAPVPRVEVTFLIDNVDQAEIKIGSKTLAFNYAALTKLKPGKYPIQYRKKGETQWREPGTLTVDALPPGQYYEVKLGAKVTATARKEGSK
jgi:hypothetical protein